MPTCVVGFAILASLTTGARADDQRAAPVNASPAGATSDGAGRSDLTSLSIDQLMNLQVTSVSKKTQSLASAAAAITVITQEDIRRSGAASIPELLRMVPGLEVARAGASSWAITARGFNSIFSNKLLVLIDGRSVYSPAFSGVFWDVQDLLLEDIERIEVIRGPAGTLYGANAVNGVINIITKNAADTQGTMLDLGAGNLRQAISARYGGTLGDEGYFRIYGKGFHNANFVDPDGAPAHDAWSQFRAGFRLDWTPGNDDTLMAAGAYYNGNADGEVLFGVLTPPSTPESDNTQLISGGHGLVRWQHQFSDTSDMMLQLYYDRTERNEKSLLELGVDTYDVDFQHHFRWGDDQDLIWGAGFREVDQRTANSAFLGILPTRASDQIYSLFVQDDIALRDNLHLTAGSKFEHNSFTGFEYQPSLALSWQPDPTDTLWTSFSRTVRTPSFAERGLFYALSAIPNPVPGGLPILIQTTGNPGQKSEHALTGEIGYRGELSSSLSLDVTGFYTRYTQLASVETETPIVVLAPIPHLLVLQPFANLQEGQTYGIEASLKWQVSPIWRLTASYTWLGVGLNLVPPSNSVTFRDIEQGSTPDYQAQIHSYLELPENLEFDTAAYYVDRLPSENTPAYVRLDARLGWRPDPMFEFSLSGQNLLQAKHAEFGSVGSFTESTEVPRSFLFQATAHL